MKFCNTCGQGNPPDAPCCADCSSAFGVGGNAEGGMGPGTVMGGDRYEILRHLGQGGMGSVYLARDTRLKREVAVKLLNHDLVGHPTARARMEREAEALARLKHPNVVDIYDVLEHDGTLALVIEYVDGGSLTDALANGPMPWREAIDLAEEILAGLQAMHEAGLVHRDLKPDNVLIDGKRGDAKITDLGVAHDAAGRGMTRQGARLGTPEYMSPEQVQGREVDARTDLYACGILLFEVVVGTVPFEGHTEFEIWKGHVERPPDLDQLPQEVPAALRAVLETALTKDADGRHESAEAMREALALAKADAPRHTPTSAAKSPMVDAAAPVLPATDPTATDTTQAHADSPTTTSPEPAPETSGDFVRWVAPSVLFLLLIAAGVAALEATPPMEAHEVEEAETPTPPSVRSAENRAAEPTTTGAQPSTVQPVSTAGRVAARPGSGALVEVDEGAREVMTQTYTAFLRRANGRELEPLKPFMTLRLYESLEQNWARFGHQQVLIWLLYSLIQLRERPELVRVVTIIQKHWGME
ncbi:MAG: protein kinase, partial [Myxococcota bacterium]|nr:protein kinase [Myxococcota bacterium]